MRTMSSPKALLRVKLQTIMATRNIRAAYAISCLFLRHKRGVTKSNLRELARLNIVSPVNEVQLHLTNDISRRANKIGLMKRFDLLWVRISELPG